jgi:hypothetical protein
MTLELNITSLDKTINVHVSQINISSHFHSVLAKEFVRAIRKQAETYLDMGYCLSFTAPEHLLK